MNRKSGLTVVNLHHCARVKSKQRYTSFKDKLINYMISVYRQKDKIKEYFGQFQSERRSMFTYVQMYTIILITQYNTIASNHHMCAHSHCGQSVGSWSFHKIIRFRQNFLLGTVLVPGGCGKSVIFPHLIGFHSSRQKIYVIIQLDYSQIYVFYTHPSPPPKIIFQCSMYVYFTCKKYKRFGFKNRNY